MADFSVYGRYGNGFDVALRTIYRPDWIHQNHYDMRKRIIATAILYFAFLAAVVALAGCNSIREWTSREPATINTSFSVANTLLATRSESRPDTNSFILNIRNSGGDVIYNGLYGLKPAEMTIPAGAYTLSVISEEFDAPAWETPVYGDSVDIVVASGETANVSFVCRMLNTGVRIRMSERYLSKYPGSLVVEQDGGALSYTYGEQRFGYFCAGNATFKGTDSKGAQEVLFSKNFNAGDMLTLSLDATSVDSRQSVSISVDTTRNWCYEAVVVGRYAGDNGDGKTAATAFSPSAAQSHVGETAWVWGYIVGGDLSSSAISFEPPFTKATNLAIAESPVCTTRSECLSVELASGSEIRNGINLTDHPEMLGRKVAIQGTITASYLGLVGLKSVKDYSVD